MSIRSTNWDVQVQVFQHDNMHNVYVPKCKCKMLLQDSHFKMGHLKTLKFQTQPKCFFNQLMK